MGDLASLGDLRGKRVLVRSDLNVPLEGATITDDGRIRASLPTIRALAEGGARVIVCAHLGRPKGQPDPAFSLAPVAVRLGDLLGEDVAFATDTVGPSARAVVAAMADGEIVLLENLRFNPGETAKADPDRADFADALASLADAYVSDGFGVVHRKQASVYDVASRLPAAMGGLVKTEVDVLRRLTQDPERPYVVVLGGAKVADKLAVIDNLLGKADRLLIGGGMLFTFLAAQGHEIGASLFDADSVEACRDYLARAQESGVEIVLPVDVVCGREFSAATEIVTVPAQQIPADMMGLDIGPESSTLYADKLADARTIFWNGPMGAFEMEPYAAGTRAVAQALADASAGGALTVVGGGDSAAAVRQLGFADEAFGHISTGGGASLEYLEGKELPGISILDKEN